MTLNLQNLNKNLLESNESILKSYNYDAQNKTYK